MKYNKFNIRFCSYLLAMMLLLSALLIPQSAQAEEALDHFAMSKMSEKVLEAYTAGEAQDVIVVLNTHADTDGAIAEMAQGSAYPLTHQQRTAAVVGELKITALASQAPLLDYLAEYQQAGKVFDINTYYVINAIRVNADHEVIRRLAFDSRVESIYANEHIEAVQPIITQNGQNPELPAADDIEWNIKHVYADKVWEEFNLQGDGVTVGIIDSGVNALHPALKTKFKGYDEATDSYKSDLTPYWFDGIDPSNLIPTDDPDAPHGSHCMGTILGSEGLKNRIGVAPNANFIAARALSAHGGSADSLLACAEWMLAPGGDPNNAPRVINNSWGGRANLDPWFMEVLQNWRSAGIVPVFAAGNTQLGDPPPWPGSISNPANYLDTFAVGAIDINNKIGDFSLLGPSLFDPTGKVIKPEVSAPGVNIRSSVMDSNYAGGWNGTSMAAPHVTGTIALMLQINPNLTVEEIEDILIKTAMPLKDEVYKKSPNMGYGYGCINTYDACAQVIGHGIGKLTGKLLEAGTDQDKPVVKLHYPEKVFAGQDLPLRIEAFDNVGVLELKLAYRSNVDADWTETVLEIDEGDEKYGVYNYTIPADQVLLPSVQVRLTVDDFGNNLDSQIVNIPVLKGVLPNQYKEDFEDEILGWYLERSWMRGMPQGTLEPDALSGSYVLGTNVGENFIEKHPGKTPPPEEEPGKDPEDGGYLDPGVEPVVGDFIATMPPIDLQNFGGQTIKLSFHHYLKVAETTKAFVEVSTNLTDWQILKEVPATNIGWEKVDVDLSGYAGMAETLYLRFRVNVNGGINRGWYLEDLVLTAVAGSTTGDTIGIYKTPETNIDTNPDVNSLLLQFPDQSMPIAQGTIRVLESGRSILTDNLGDYSMIHAVNHKQNGKWTIRAEAYGYRAEERVIELEKDQIQDQTFVLEPLQKSYLKVNVIDGVSKEPIENVALRLLEEPNVQVVATDAAGAADLKDVYEGSYTLKAFKPGYEVVQRAVSVFATGDNSVTVELLGNTGDEFPMQYMDMPDDPMYENSHVWRNAGLGLGLRFTATEHALLKDADLYFSDRHNFAKGTEIGVVALLKDEQGKYKLAGEMIKIDVTPGSWYKVNLETYGLRVKPDDQFMIATVQLHEALNSPALGLMWGDMIGKDNSFAYAGPDEIFQLSEVDPNNWQTPMIRANLVKGTAPEANLPAPVLTSHDYLNYTRESVAKIEGTTTADGKINIYHEGNDTISTVAKENKFSAEVTLKDGENRIAVQLEDGTTISDKSLIHNIILDQKAPTMTVNVPDEKITVKEMIYTVKGTVEDEYLNAVLLDGKEISVTDNTFEQRIKLKEGENTIVLKAIDKAGNETVITRTIVFKPESAFQAAKAKVDRYDGIDRYVVAAKLSQDTYNRNDTVILTNGDVMSDLIVAGPLSVALDAPILLTKADIIPETTIREIARLKAKKIIIVGGELTVHPVVEDALVSFEVERLDGLTRIETSLAVAEKIQSVSPGDTVVMTNGYNFNDAITIVPATTKIGQGTAPIVFVNRLQRPAAVDEFLKDKGYKNIKLIGNEKVVSQSMEADLKKNFAVERIGGADCYATAVEIAKRYFGDFKSFAVASSLKSIDALTASAFATREEMPILLTGPKTLHDSVKPFLSRNTQRVLILGGPATLKPAVEIEIYQLLK